MTNPVNFLPTPRHFFSLRKYGISQFNFFQLYKREKKTFARYCHQQKNAHCFFFLFQTNRLNQLSTNHPGFVEMPEGKVFVCFNSAGGKTCWCYEYKRAPTNIPWRYYIVLNLWLLLPVISASRKNIFIIFQEDFHSILLRMRIDSPFRSYYYYFSFSSQNPS